MYISKVYKEVSNTMVLQKRSGSNKLYNLEGPRKMSTVEKADFSTQEVSVHRQHPLCISIKGHNWAQNESWKIVSWSKRLVSSKNHGSHSACLSLACALHNRASAVTAHGLILACWFNICRVPIKFIWWQLVAPVVIYKQQQQHNTAIWNSKRNSTLLCNVQHWRLWVVFWFSRLLIISV